MACTSTCISIIMSIGINQNGSPIFTLRVRLKKWTLRLNQKPEGIPTVWTVQLFTIHRHFSRKKRTIESGNSHLFPPIFVILNVHLVASKNWRLSQSERRMQSAGSSVLSPWSLMFFRYSLERKPQRGTIDHTSDGVAVNFRSNKASINSSAGWDTVLALLAPQSWPTRPAPGVHALTGVYGSFYFRRCKRAVAALVKTCS